MIRTAAPMKSHAFIVSKPLQLIVALSIINQLGIARSSHVIVVDAFADAHGVAKRAASMPGLLFGFSVTFVTSAQEAYDLLRKQRFPKVFLDADVGSRKLLTLLRIRLAQSKTEINVYEEGLGTYRTDLYTGMKKRMLDFAGVATRFGGCRLTSTLYLYDPQEYECKFPGGRPRLVQIKKKLADFLVEFFNELGELFGYVPLATGSRAECNVYLSSWSIDASFVCRFKSLPGDNYIKPHPHITSFQNDHSAFIIDPSAPAEMALLDLLKQYDSINVYHHGSSVERYITSDRIKYIKL